MVRKCLENSHTIESLETTDGAAHPSAILSFTVAETYLRLDLTQLEVCVHGGSEFGSFDECSDTLVSPAEVTHPDKLHLIPLRRTRRSDQTYHKLAQFHVI